MPERYIFRQLLHAAGMMYWARHAAYFATETDADGARLSGDRPYVIRFRPRQLPKTDVERRDEIWG